MTVQKILLIDDDPVIRNLISGILRKRGYHVSLAKEGQEGLRVVKSIKPDLVIADFQMPGMSGIDVLNHIKEIYPAMPVIILTAHGDATLTIQSMQTGAFDFIEKPVKPKELLDAVKNGLNTVEAVRHKTEGMVSREETRDSNLMVGKSSLMREIFKNIGRISQSNVGVLITGETGTGKERLARLIHQSGSAQPGPLTILNCNTLTDDQLLNAFWVSDEETASPEYGRASIILDGVGGLPPAMQIRLLDILNRKTGDSRTASMPRLISITSQDINQLVMDGLFMKELFFKMKIISLHIPPLRQRKDDIPDLVKHLMQELNPVLNKNVTQLEEGVFQMLKSYDWPGNVQELKNVLMQAMVLSHGEILEKKNIHIETVEKGVPESTGFEKPPKSLAEMEKEHIAAVLDYVQWSKQEASGLLGIARPTLNAKIEKYGLTKK